MGFPCKCLYDELYSFPDNGLDWVVSEVRHASVSGGGGDRVVHHRGHRVAKVGGRHGDVQQMAGVVLTGGHAAGSGTGAELQHDTHGAV